ncbi:alpha/beta hydrolase [Streptomyces sp. NPDC026672]|uniref:alpha/beta fold hydrolase n=1 Tax=unclassified Streptomyces TaxID=2593676 RepID=UPI0033EC2F38
MSYFALEDRRLFHTLEGHGEEMLLLVHGGMSDSHDWTFQAGPLTARHRVLMVDLEGHGRSTEAPAGHGPSDHAADLALLLQHLDAGPVTVVGHSYGALVASILAVEHPQAIRAVVAVDPAWGFSPEAAAETARTFRVPDPVTVGVAVLSQLGSTGPVGTASRLGEWRCRRALGMSAAVTSGVFLGIFDTEAEKTVRGRAEEYLLRRDCPVLTVSAAASLEAKGIDATWDATVSRHPYSRSVVWPDVGHWLFQDRPDEFTDLLVDWIKDLP